MGLIRLAHRFLVRQTMPAAAVPYYDRMLSAVEDFYLRPFCERVGEAFPGSATILDMGTGAGHLPVKLARGNEQYRITGIDLSEPMLEVARAKAERYGLGDRVEFIRGDITNVQLPARSFDLAISTCSLHHWRWPVRVLRRASQLIRDNGHIWLIDDRAGMSREERQRWIARVEGAVGRRLRLFRCVYTVESRFLSYSRGEMQTLCRNADLSLVRYDEVGGFFIAQLAHGRTRGRQQHPSPPPVHDPS